LAIHCRLHLTGRLTLQGPRGLLSQEALPRRQGRLALAHLALRRPQLVPRNDLAATLWPAAPPPSMDAALSAVVSKLRRALEQVGVGDAITSGGGCYALKLPAGAWVDAEYAARQLDLAEAAVRRGRPVDAWAPSTVGTAILRRPLLPGEDGPWVDAERRRLQALLLRAGDCLAAAWLARGDGALAQRVVEEALTIAPFREGSHRLLMRAHLAQGNRAEALLAFQRCRALLVRELGVEPEEETQRLHRQLLEGRAPA
jgi:DNA-binding SARP family transcriptional activator